MVQVARCACGKECRTDLHGFLYSVRIEGTDSCDKCRESRVRRSSRTWRFCSPQCLLKYINLCPSCGGNGRREIFEGNEMGRSWELCGQCEGRGLENVRGAAS